ncbi:MAG: hypothetical protein HND55_03200 [Pseudomonadota bacterium]|nr:MAG: hypothetical protein HND55_03200 [Pseudomonadota bacterium]
MRILALTIMLGALVAAGSARAGEPGSGQPGSAPPPLIAAPESSPKRSTDHPAEQFSHWLRRAAEAYQEQDIEQWVAASRQLHKLRPYNQDIMRHLVEGNARLGNLSEAFAMMLKMQQQGLAENWDKIEAVEPMRRHDLYSHLNGLMKEAGEPVGEVTEWSRLESGQAMPEALAYDKSGDRVFAGTVRDGLILVTSDGENWTRFVSADSLPQLQAVFSLAVDAERGALWVASGRVSQFHGRPHPDGVRSSLLRLDLESGELEQEYQLSKGGGRNLLGNLVLASDGTVFANDMELPFVYWLRPGAEALEPFFGHANLASLRGMALSGDDRLLYVADYEHGIFIVDAKAGKQAWKLAVPDTLNEGGIDGLYWWDGHLVTIQNGISPQRIMRLELGEDGLGVTSVAPLAAAVESFDTPTFGFVRDDDLFFLGGSHWHHVDAQGVPDEPLPEVPVLRVNIADAANQIVGEHILQQLRQQMESGDSDQ